MAVYTAPSMSFIDSYVNAAKYRDQRTDAAKQRASEGMANLVKGGAEAYKWQKRKDILDEAASLDEQEKELLAEIERLKGERDTGTANMDAIMSSTGWKGIPFPYSPAPQESAPAPRPGVGIFKKEFL